MATRIDAILVDAGTKLPEVVAEPGGQPHVESAPGDATHGSRCTFGLR